MKPRWYGGGGCGGGGGYRLAGNMTMPYPHITSEGNPHATAFASHVALCPL